MTATGTKPAPSRRRGRPRGTSARELETIALRLFSQRGYDAVTVEELAAEAGVSRRTFHRYFPVKADVLWQGFDAEVAELERTLAATPDSVPTLTAISDAVVAVNRHRREDQPELRTRLDLIVHVPQVRSAAGERYEAWEQVIAGFVARRHPSAPPMLAPAVARATLAVCRTAFDFWLAQPTRELTDLLAEAIDLLADGFAPLTQSDPTEATS